MLLDIKPKLALLADLGCRSEKRKKRRLKGNDFKFVRRGEGCFIPDGAGRFSGYLLDLVSEMKCFRLKQGISLVHTRPWPEDGALLSFYFIDSSACDNCISFSPKRAREVKNSAKCRKND